MSSVSSHSIRRDLLLQEQAGYIELDEDETVESVTQHSIATAVDIISAQKFFELKLEKFGPYCCDYTKNGRYLLLAGKLGHIASIDWQTKDLKCETHVKEAIHDIKWLHQETQYAVAQRQWTYIYDNQGIEIHCLKLLDRVLRLEYLPYHFLLACAHEKSYLTWLDISVGKKVAGFGIGHGRLNIMCQNRTNGVLHLGHSSGAVTLWSPNVKEFLVKMKCHNAPLSSVAVDHSGRYMATSGVDRKLKVWDVRTYKCLQSYNVSQCAGQLTFSQRGVLAASQSHLVEVYRDICKQTVMEPYLMHRLPSSAHSVHFCPYEDVLGVGHAQGFSSILVPGSGEPNFDALEANPFQTKQQRREAEVKSLLDKVQPEMITLDPAAIGFVNVKSVQEKMEEKAKLLFVKPKKIDFEPRNRRKGKGKIGKREQRKRGVIEEEKLRAARLQTITDRQRENPNIKQSKTRMIGETTPLGPTTLDRFRKREIV